MNTKRFSWVMIALTILAFGLVVSSIVLGNRILVAKSAQLHDVKLNSQVLDAQQANLTKANKDIAKYADLERTAKSIVPQDKDQAKTVREIINYASEVNIGIQSISFPTSTLGQATAVAPTTTGETKPTTPAAPVVSQVKPVEGIKGVYQLELTVQSDAKKPVTFNQLITFLSKLEENRRTAQVTGLSITPKLENRNLLTFTLNINVYIKP
jgi:hypothetical protein